MEIEAISLIIPAFIAGLLTFLAPCTLPLVPGFLGFIAGVSAKELAGEGVKLSARKRVLKNGLMYVLGFSVVFILLGSLFGAAGAFLAPYRVWLSRIGGVVIIFFGLYLMHAFDLKFLQFLSRQKRFSFTKKLTPGKPLSSFVFGATFALGWTPCVGPVLGTVLLLASTSGQVLQGAFLLAVFSAGLAIPFLLLALGIGHAQAYVRKLSKVLNIISIVGGVFLIFIGVLLLTDSFGAWIGTFYQYFNFLNADALLNYL
ncbi:MAG: cytochrome c biogenesis protein CcdA [Candidatus Magasanikbacteria bacterium]|nr:cytochrome c biogenesis protein CcdA [Candidatus Magasanikbacteria bacterium]